MFASLVPNVTPVLAAAAAGGGAPNSLINLVPLIPAIPLAGFVFTALFGRRIGQAAFVLPLLAVTATWLLSMAVVYQALDRRLRRARRRRHALALDPGGRVHGRRRVLRRLS